MLILGHHHSAAILPTRSYGKKIVNGSWLKANNLTKRVVAAQVPSQSLWFTHPEHFMTAYYEIRMGKVAAPDIDIISA